MHRIIATLLAVSIALFGEEKFIRRTLAEKTAAKDLTFLAAFDNHDINAAFAKGGKAPLGAMKDVSLLLRGVVGFDGEGAFKPEPGEKLRYPVAGNVDPHSGTLILWTAGLDYNPCDAETDGKKRGNVCLAHLMFKSGERYIEYKLYEFAEKVYFDWWTSEPPHGWYQYVPQYGRVFVERCGIRKGQWHQLAMTWDDVNIAIYLNGELAMTASLPEKVAKVKDIVAVDNDESFIGVKSPFFEDNHASAVGIDDFAIYSRPLSKLEIRNQYLALLNEKGKQKIQAYSIVVNGVDTGHEDRFDRVEVEMDLASLPPQDQAAFEAGKLKMSYILTGPNGKNVAKGAWKLSKKFDSFIIEGVKMVGKYTLTTRTSNAEVVETFDKPDMSWTGNGLGDEDEVPELWRDFAVDGRTVTLWNRSYAFGNGPLPERILAYGGKELLERRPRLLIDGAEPSWKAGKVEKRVRWVDFHCTGKAGKATLKCRTRVEYDGLVKFDWTIDGRPEISSMTLDWKMSPENRQFLMAPNVYEGTEPQAEFCFPKGYGQGRELWMVSEKRGGFAYAMENDANWIYDAEQPVLFANLQSGECKVTMVTKKTAMPQSVPYSALFIATPTRPLPKENRVIRFGDYVMGGKKYLVNAGGNGGFKGIFTHAPHETDFAYRRKNAVPNSESVFGGVALTDLMPSLQLYKKYWEIPGSHSYNMPYHRPVGPGKYVKEYHASVSVCPSTSVSDYYLWCQKQLYEHPDSGCIWQVYYDICGNGQCRSRLHGCGFKDAFGRDIASFEILNKRNLVRRTVAFAHRHGKTVILHAQRDFFPMLHGQADYFYPGEQYDSLLRRNPFGYTDDIPDTIYRSEFNRNVLGIGVIHLPALGQASPKNFSIPSYTEAMLCMLQSHDIETAPLYVCTAPVNKLYDILERYGVQSPDVKCHLYYEQSEIKSSDPSLRVTWYECPEDRRLLFIANKGVQPVRSTIDVSAVAGGDFWAFDEYHNKDITVKDGKFDIYVPGRSFSVVCFPPKSIYPLHDGMDKIWRIWKSKSDTEFTLSKDGGIDGSSCLMLTTHETGGGCFHYDFRITPGHTYIYKVKARRSNMDGDFCLMIQARVGEKLRGGDARPVATYSEPSTEWKEVLLKFTVPTKGAWSECDNVLLTLSGKGKNAVISFDDFSIEESFDTAELLDNKGIISK